LARLRARRGGGHRLAPSADSPPPRRAKTHVDPPPANGRAGAGESGLGTKNSTGRGSTTRRPDGYRSSTHGSHGNPDDPEARLLLLLIRPETSKAGRQSALSRPGSSL